MDMDEEKCPECGANLVYDSEHGEILCESCGIVVEAVIDEGPEWREFEGDNKRRARTGPPRTVMRHDHGMGSQIDWKNRDASGRPLSPRSRRQMQRVRQWDRRTRFSKAADRNLAYALLELDRMGSSLGLPRSVRESAAHVYRQALAKNLIRGRSIEGVVASCLYGACRMCSVPRTLDEIAQTGRIGRKEIGRIYRFLARELKLRTVPTSPEDYVGRFCSELKLSSKVQRRANDLLRTAAERELVSGRGPTGVAAAGIYIASILCGERRTQREVADVAGVTEVTVRNRYKELCERLGIEVVV